jgi:hypothetical protein
MLEFGGGLFMGACTAGHACVGALLIDTLFRWSRYARAARGSTIHSVREVKQD